MAHHDLEVLAHGLSLIIDPPVPPVLVVFVIAPLWHTTVGQGIAEGSERWDDVKGIPDTANNFIRFEIETTGQVDWVMCLDDPCSIIDDELTFKTLDLQTC